MGDGGLDASALLIGRLLVATPALEDSNFSRSVVLVLEHGAEGALGVIINRPSDLTVADPLPAWAPVTADPPVVFMGGPVSPGSVLALGRPDWADGPADDGLRPVAVDLDAEPNSLGPLVGGVRIFAGYASWAPRQLEAEIIAGGWFVVAAEPADAFSSIPTELWWEVLGRQDGALATFANFPLDPSVN